MTKPAVLFEKINQHIGLVTINRPEAMNAVNSEVALVGQCICKSRTYFFL